MLLPIYFVLGLVNCVGTHPPARPIDDFTSDDFRQLLEINLVSYFHMTKAALPLLRTWRGSIVNVSSLSAVFGQGGAATYCATKGAITAMTKGLAIDEAKHGVRVNAISPGNVWTPLWEEHVAGPNAAALKRGGERQQVLGRMGAIEECGEVALHLATATYTTGHDYLMTGGAELGYSPKDAYFG